MSTSRSKPKLTKAGVALDAAARNKLQQVARWMSDELKGNQDPRIILGFSGGIATNTKINLTVMSPFGVLVQMYDPMNCVDMKYLERGVYVSTDEMIRIRAAKILGITELDFLLILKYVYATGWIPDHVIHMLRGLK